MPKITYWNAAGEEVPSTTTIINKYKDVGGLMYFAWSEGKAGRGLNESRDRAGDVGSMLHGQIDAFLKDELWGLPVDAHPEDAQIAARLYATFREWWAHNKIEVVATETSLVSETYQYGGTVDLVGNYPGGGLIIMDWKTSSAFYQEMLLQMAAYRRLWQECKQQVIERATLALFSKTDRKIKFYPVTNEQMGLGFEKFLLLRKAYDMEAAIAKSVKETRHAAVSYDHGSGQAKGVGQSQGPVQD